MHRHVFRSFHKGMGQARKRNFPQSRNSNVEETIPHLGKTRERTMRTDTDLDPFFTLHEGKITLDFIIDHEDIIRIYANDILVFIGRLRELVYRIYLTGENLCELNFKKVLKLNIDGNALYGRIHKAFNNRKENKNEKAF